MPTTAKICGKDVVAEEELFIDKSLSQHARHDETIWEGSCPAGYTFQQSKPGGRPVAYVAREKSFDICDNDPQLKDSCCAVSETSWAAGGGASTAHWLQGDMRRLGKCKKKQTVGHWRSCRKDSDI